jgi:hypothetical protein
MNSAANKNLRDDAGRYAASLDAVCKCGCRKGEHAAGPKGRSNGECLTCNECHGFAANKETTTMSKAEKMIDAMSDTVIELRGLVRANPTNSLLAMRLKAAKRALRTAYWTHYGE